MKSKKFLAVGSTLLLVAGLFALGTSAASAHNANITGTAACQTDGTYTVTWTYNNMNTPSNMETDVVVDDHSPAGSALGAGTSGGYLDGSDLYLSSWTSHLNGHPIPVKTGNWSSTFVQTGVPGNSTSATVTTKSTWNGWNSGTHYSNTGSRSLAGNCTIPTPLDASATATPTPATCQAKGGVTFTVKNATWENTTDITDGSRRAYANTGHLFPGGFNHIDVGYTIEPQLSGAQCDTEVTPPVKPTVTNELETCDVTNGQKSTTSGTITFGAGDWTWYDANNVEVTSGTHNYAPGTYDFTVTATTGHKFDKAGTKTLSFSVTVESKVSTGPCLTELIPVKPLATSTDVCGTANDSLDVDSSSDFVKYEVTWNKDHTVATVTASVKDASKYYFKAGAVTSWDFSFTNVPCVVTIDTVPFATAQTCAPTSQLGTASLKAITTPGYTYQEGGITVALNANLKYTITGTGSTIYGPTVVTSAFTNLDPGTYSVTVEALNGYVFAKDAITSWPLAVTAGLCAVTVGDPYAVDQVCSGVAPNATTSGYIWVDFAGNLANEVEYTITGNGTTNYPAKVVTNSVTDLPPGSYTVTVAAKAGFTLQGDPAWGPFIIRDAGTCDLVTHPLISTTATFTKTTCSASGTYTLANTEGVLWFVNGSKTPTAPGTYKVDSATTVNVVAETTGPDFGWEDGAQTQWTFNFTNPVDCLPTLAFTGASGGYLGLLMAGGFLFFGGIVFAFDKKFRFGRN